MSDRVERELLVAASPEEVWEAVVGDGWLAESVRLELRPGGDAWFGDQEGVRTGWIEEALPPSDDRREGRLAFWWSADDEPPTRVEITIRRQGDCTQVGVIEARPLELLDLVGVPLAGIGGRSYGPALAA